MSHPTRLIRTIALVGGLLIVSGCASASTPQPAVCDGQHRRPANPYGSVLPTTPATETGKPNGASTPTPPSEPAPAPATAPGAGAALDPMSFLPCGAGA